VGRGLRRNKSRQSGSIRRDGLIRPTLRGELGIRGGVEVRLSGGSGCQHLASVLEQQRYM